MTRPVRRPDELARVAQEVNARPRKALDWARPVDRLADLTNTGAAATA